MIVYFSGTGNSRYVAELLAERLDDRCVPLAEISSHDLKIEGQVTGLVFPVYSWGVPPVVIDFITGAPDGVFPSEIWAVCTCGDEVARTPEMLSRVLESRGMSLKGIWSVIMPNNYVLLPGFGTDPVELERRKLAEAPDRVENIAGKIKNGLFETDVPRGSLPRLKSALVYPLFKKYGTTFGKWKVSDSCISCGLCRDVCPVGNISMCDGKPVWGERCTSCVACFHVCPRRAIDYSGYTKGKKQYNTLLRKNKKA